MSDKGPLEIIDRFAKAVEAHPGALPLTQEDLDALRRVRRMLNRLDVLLWFLGWGKWVIAGLVFIVTQWDRIERTLKVWGGQ